MYSYIIHYKATRSNSLSDWLTSLTYLYKCLDISRYRAPMTLILKFDLNLSEKVCNVNFFRSSSRWQPVFSSMAAICNEQVFYTLFCRSSDFGLTKSRPRAMKFSKNFRQNYLKVCFISHKVDAYFPLYLSRFAFFAVAANRVDKFKIWWNRL